MKTAKEWLLAHGYKQFQDGTWSWEGYEADVAAALQEYMDEQEVETQQLCGWDVRVDRKTEKPV